MAPGFSQTDRGVSVHRLERRRRACEPMSQWMNILAATDSVERRLEFVRAPGGWFAVAAIVLLTLMLAAVMFFYAHEQRSGASPRARRGLAVLRCLVVLILAAVWLEPVLATYLHRRSEAYTLVLVDASASMGLPDHYRDADERARVVKLAPPSGDALSGISRWDLANTLLARAESRWLRDLAARNAVRVVRFGDVAETVGELQATSGDANVRRPDSRPAQADACASIISRLATSRPDGPATDLGRAVRQAVESTGGNPVAGLVVLSDGRFNRGEPIEVVAQYARDKRIPVYTVGVGDPAPPRNLAVAGIEAPPNVFVQDPFKITAHLRAEGMDDASLAVELLERTSGETQLRVIATQQVRIPAGGQIPPVTFNHRIAEASESRMSVRVAPHENETLTDDNLKETTVRALANKMRVLLVSGGPSWEYRYVSRLLERDKTADVSCWMQSADEQSVREGNTIINHFPTESGELAQYDCIVLMDPRPGDIDAPWVVEMEKMISDRGCGLLYVAGRQNTPRLTHDPQSKPLLDLLPVVFDPGEADLVLNELGHFQRTDWPVAIPPSAASSPVLAMSDRPEENAEIWTRLGGVFWHYPVRREKPVATVLLRHANPAMHNAYGSHILLATQFVGSGRTGYMAFDSTWRWRRYGDAYFNRFWIQLLRHMVEGKLLSGQRRGFIQVERDQVSVGEPATVEARLLDATYQPLSQPEVQATVGAEGAPEARIILQAQPNRPGWYRGQWVPTRVGSYTIRVDLPAAAEGTSGDVTIRGELRVGRPDLEFRNTSLDRDALRQLAERSAGGRYLNIDEADDLPGLIPSKVSTLVLTGQPTPLWDRWWTLLVLVLLLTAEWMIRKRVHML